MSTLQQREGIEGTIHEPSTIINRDGLLLPSSSRIDSYTLINASGGVSIGDESCIHSWSGVIGSGGLEMRDRAVVTYGARLITSTADLRYPASSVVPREERGSFAAKITLGDESFVGANAVVMPGVEVAEGAVVAAGAYVDDRVPPYTIRYPDGREEPRPGDWPRPTLS